MKTLLISIIVILFVSVTVNTIHVFADTLTPYLDVTTDYGGLVGWRQADFKSDHGNYSIWYKITNGTVINTPLDLSSKTLLFMIKAPYDGQLIVQLPRSTIDSKNQGIDQPYFVAVRGTTSGLSKVNATETSDEYVRTLKINFTKYTSEIEIVGTFFVENHQPVIKILSNPSSSPLQQFKSGIDAKDVKCKEGLQIILKAENGSPACVKLTSIQKLVLLHWALKPVNELTVEEFKDPYKAGEKIDFVMKFKGLYACGYPSAIVKNAENNTVWESPIELTLCDPDTGYGEYKWRFVELYNVILNKTGSYRVDISFSDKKLEKEFEIK